MFRVIIRLVVALCGTAGAAQAQIEGSCDVQRRPATKLRLDDGRTVYVEPMTFAHNRATAVLAGEPMYVWSMSGSAPLVDTLHGLLGVTFSGTNLMPLPKPDVPGVVTHVRFAPDGDNFAAVFAVTDSSSVGRYEPKVLSYWAGRTDGRTWTSIEQLSLPPRPLDARSATRIVAARGELLIAVSFGLGADESVAIYTRTSRGWRLDTLSGTGISYLALTAVAEEPILYVVSASATFGVANDLFAFYKTGRSWRETAPPARGSQRPVHHPKSIAVGNSAFLSWLEERDRSGPWIARAAALDRDGSPGALTTLGGQAEDIEPVPDPAGPRFWMVEGSQDTTSTITLVEWTRGEPVVRDLLLNPFRGPSLAAWVGDEPVAIGPLFDPSGREETVVSGILRFRTRCASRMPPETP